MKLFVSRRFLVPCNVLILCLSTLFIASVQAQTTLETSTTQSTVETPTVTALPVIEPRAFEILRRADAIYKKAHSFSLQMQLRLVTTASGQDDRYTFNLQAQKFPERLRVAGKSSIGTQNVISNGQKVWRTHSKYKNEYSVEPFRAAYRSSRTNWPIESLFSGTGVEGVGLDLFFNHNISSIFFVPELQSIRVGETTTYGGVAVEPVIVTMGGTNRTETTTFSFGRDDHLLRRVYWASSIETGYVEEIYWNIRLSPELPESLFNFKPAKNMKRVPSVDPMSRDSGASTIAPIDTSQPSKSLTKKPKVKPQTTNSRSN